MSNSDRPLVLQVLPMVDQAGADALAQHVDLRTVSRDDVETIVEEGEGAVALISRSGTVTIGADVFDRLPTLAVVSSTGSGADCFDVHAATERGIPVLHNPGVAPGPVAEYVIGMIVCLSRRFYELDQYLRTGGDWSARHSPTEEARAAGVPPRGRELSGRTLGIIGLGHIGRDVARRAQRGLDMRVIAYDPALTATEIGSHGVQAFDLEELLASADIVTLHVPHTEATHHLVDAEALAAMKESAFLINAARGGVVDEAALVRALDERQLAGAAIDVFEAEPVSGDSPLFAMRNVVVTPHIAGASYEALARLSLAVADGILGALRGERPERMVEDVWPPRRLQTGAWPLATGKRRADAG